MKKYSFIAALAAAVVGLGLCVSCGSSSSKSPVDEYIDIIQSVQEMVLNATTMEELDSPEMEEKGEEMEERMENLLDKYGDYVLSDEEKDKIVNLHLKLTNHIMELAGGIPGMSLEDLMQQTADELKARVGDCKTLGDIAEMMEDAD